MTKDASSDTRVPDVFPQIMTEDVNDASYEKQSLDVVPKSAHQNSAGNPFKSLLKPTQSGSHTPMPENSNNSSASKK